MLTYFAYGSNMLSARLIARCSGARLLGPGQLADHAVGFDKRGRDGSGKATLRVEAGAVAQGALFTLPVAETLILDRIEGDGYARLSCAVQTAQGGVEAFSYIATSPETGLLPHDWYLALMLAGLAEHGLSCGGLSAHPFTPDTDPDRPARAEALAALADAGHIDWPGLLRPAPVSAP